MTDATNPANDPATVVERYFAAVASNDMATMAQLIDHEVTWHQPGANRFSGVHQGQGAVFGLIGAMVEATAGTFRLEVTGPSLTNGDLVAVPVRFSGSQGDAVMDLTGLDLHRVTDGRITEVWLFGADQPAEDAFWDAAP